MVIIRGYDSQKNLYMGSWGFNYQVPAKQANRPQVRDQSKPVSFEEVRTEKSKSWMPVTE